MTTKWHDTGYQNRSLATEDGRILGSVRGGYRTWYACFKGQSVEYLTEEQAKAAVEREVGGQP